MKAWLYSVSAIAAGGLALSTACTAKVPVDPRAAAIDELHPCKADKARSLVGRVADRGTLAKAMRLSNSSDIRIVRPGQPISMEYTTDRLTVEVDEKNRILRLYCS